GHRWSRRTGPMGAKFKRRWSLFYPDSARFDYLGPPAGLVLQKERELLRREARWRGALNGKLSTHVRCRHRAHDVVSQGVDGRRGRAFGKRKSDPIGHDVVDASRGGRRHIREGRRAL